MNPQTLLAKSAPARPPEPARARSQRQWKAALTAGFLMALIVPNLDLVFGLDPNLSPIRDPVAFPALHIDSSLARFPGKLVAYLKSSMGFRGSLVRARGLLAWRRLGVSPAPEDVVRADPWLFLRSERVIDDFRRVDPFSSADLERWRSVLEARRAWLAARGIRYLFVVAPNKETIYAEAMPPWFTRAPGPSRLTQLKEYLARTAAVDFLDLAPALTSHKPEARLYHFTDTHWNDLGAFVGYQAIAQRLERSFPRWRALDAGDVIREARLTPGGDLARMCGLKSDLGEPQDQLRLPPSLTPGQFADGSPVTFERMDVRGNPSFQTHGPAGEIPSAVIIRDSFGEALLPYLSRHFQTATWLWTYDFPADLIDRQRPAVVIQQIAERRFMVLEPSNPPLVGAPG